MDLQTISNEIKAAQDQCKQIEPLTSRFADFSNGKAYAVAQLIHKMRIKEGAVVLTNGQNGRSICRPIVEAFSS